VFSLDFADVDHFNEDVEFLQYLHRDSVLKKELEVLWKKHSALKPAVLAGFLFGKPVINFLKRELNSKFKSKFSDDEIKEAVKKVITEATCLGDVKPIKEKKKKDSIVEAKSPTESTEPSIPSQQV
jgi:hypothetical protein